MSNNDLVNLDTYHYWDVLPSDKLVLSPRSFTTGWHFMNWQKLKLNNIEIEETSEQPTPGASGGAVPKRRKKAFDLNSSTDRLWQVCIILYGNSTDRLWQVCIILYGNSTDRLWQVCVILYGNSTDRLWQVCIILYGNSTDRLWQVCAVFYRRLLIAVVTLCLFTVL